MIKRTLKYIITDSDWDKLVKDTYGLPYCFQQQEGCRDRGTYEFVVPNNESDDSFEDIPEICNDPKMGVRFDLWMNRNPKEPIKNQEYDWELTMWWERNFYPDVQVLAQDLYSKGLLEAGEYLIEVDW